MTAPPSRPLDLSSWALFSRFRFGEFLFKLVDPVLQRRQARVDETHIEERHVVGGRIKRVAVTQPRGIVELDICKAEFLEDARRFRGSRAALAVDDGFLVGIEP